jgi:phospholipid/cholesterol/gamma-HCH transport system ATP-binding protein
MDGATILRGIDFTLENDHNLVVIGRSGSGKTMLIKTIMGFYNPSSGSVVVDDIDVYDSDPSEPGTGNRFAMVFQNAALLDSFTVYQNVALPLYYSGNHSERIGSGSGDTSERILQALEVVGLPDCGAKYPAELSGGMRKRVGIARALVSEPNYIIFDEPLSGLDPITAKEVLYYITQVINTQAVTAITITHDMRDLGNIGDRALFLESGSQVFYGDIPALYASHEPLIRQFVGNRT